MVGIILASHGDFAKGILQSGEMIFGTQPDVKAVTLQPSEGPDDIRAKMEEAITTFGSKSPIYFLYPHHNLLTKENIDRILPIPFPLYAFNFTQR